MTPYADHFMLSMLQHSWETVLAGGLASWQQVFPRALPPSFATTSWTPLSTKGVIFRSAFSLPGEEPEAAAVISVALVPEELKQEFFGNAHGQMDATLGEADNDRWSTLNQATLNVYIYATPKDLVRALHTFVTAAVHSNEEWLMRCGFEQMWFLGASDLAPKAELFPKGTDIFGRVLRYGFSGMTDVGRIVGEPGVTPSWITVADESVFVDKYVDPSTGQEHSLEEMVLGGMKPRLLDDE